MATIENAPAQVLSEIEGITAVAAQIIFGTTPQKPLLMADYLEDLADWDLQPVGWGWCNATEPSGAQAEGNAHAQLALDLGLTMFIANMEEPYDAHGDQGSVKFHMPDDYATAFRKVAPNVEFAVTTTPNWGSNGEGLRQAGAAYMPQAFPLENGKSVADAVTHGQAWGWPSARQRPLVQVYETNEQVPPAQPYLDDSARYAVGVVPYILEQALGGQGRALLTALVPAITRQPSADGSPPKPEEDMTKIGDQDGITAAMNRLRALDPGGTRVPQGGTINDLPSDLSKWGAWDKLERTLRILKDAHDDAA